MGLNQLTRQGKIFVAGSESNKSQKGKSVCKSTKFEFEPKELGEGMEEAKPLAKLMFCKHLESAVLTSIMPSLDLRLSMTSLTTSHKVFIANFHNDDFESYGKKEKSIFLQRQ